MWDIIKYKVSTIFFFMFIRVISLMMHKMVTDLARVMTWQCSTVTYLTDLTRVMTFNIMFYCNRFNQSNDYKYNVLL